MKRKYLSALLMGTLTVASMSTFTSCKDYDDDISNLQGQIDKLASADELKQKVSELQALISANQSGINSLQSELAKKTTLDEVKAVLANYATNENVTKEANEIVNAAIKALQDKDIAELKTAIEAAQKTADQAVKDAADAKAEILKTLEDYALKSDVDAVRDAANTAIAAVKSENTQAINAAKTEILEKLQDYATKEALNGVAEAAKAAVEAAKADNATKLAEAKTALEAKITAAQNTADEAKTKAAENAAAILALAETTTTANSALAQANANKTAIENALKTLGTGFSEQNTVAAAIQAINGQLTAEKTGLAGLDGRLSAIEAALKGDEDSDKLPNLKLQVDNIDKKLQDIIGQYSTMVTDVQLYNFAGYNGNVNGSYHGNAYIPNGQEYGESWGYINGSAAPSVVPGWNTTLQFVQAAEKANVFPAQAGVATEQLKFEEGKYYAGEDSLLIRVSPVDAELTTSNVSLMNSQGKELDDIIDVTDVHRFKGLLTRASSANTGLWVVKFKATDLGDKFKEAAVVDSKKVLYAVAVKNTYNTTGEEKDANTRRVTSEFGVDLSTSNAQHAWDFDVNTKSVANIRNRYYWTETGTNTENVPELVWKDEAATTVVTDNEDDTKNNAVNRPSWSDNRKDCRQWRNILAVEKGKDITIDFSNTELKGVKGFYVTLDEAFAKESAPSELNAWNSYTYKGVGYHKNGGAYVPAELFKGSRGTIRIENLGNVQGDVIGFRVYAVNYDGTLYDPDGRSFYVAVGDVKTEMPLANAKAELDMATPTQFVSNLIDADFSKVDFDGARTWKISEKDVAGDIPSWGDFTVKYFDKDQHEISLSKDVKYIQFVLNNPQAFVDGETYNASMTLTKNISGATAEACNVTASFTKVMPTAAPTFCYRDGYSKTPEYIIPEGGDYTVGSDNKGGSFKLNNLLIIDNNNTWKGADLFEASTAGKFSFNVSNGTYDAGKKNIVSAKADVPYVLDVVNGKNNLVDNKTERTIAANYIYYNISKQYNKETKLYEPVHEYPVPSASSEKIVYCSWMKTLAVKTALKSTWTGNKGNGDGKNVVTWKATGNGGATLDLANLETAISDLNLLPAGALIADGKTFGGLIDANVVEVVNGKYGKVYTTDKNNTQINPHFSAEFNGSEVVLTQRAESTVAPSTTAGNIHFTVKDCFGNTKDIVLPFYIKK